MDLTLPKRIKDGKEVALHGANQVTIIGANGSGKSRFASKLIKACGDKAFKLSALKAIYAETYVNTLPGSIQTIYNNIEEESTLLKSSAKTEFDKLIFVLLHDEFIDLLGYKAQLIMGDGGGKRMPCTKLDMVIKAWKAVFPKNTILRESGKLLFSNEGATDVYSSMRLSDGEKAVLYYIGSVLYATEGAVIFVDAPETFIHHSIMQSVWNMIEQLRPDCSFVYSTHDIDFASSRIDNRCVWVKAFDADQEAWDYELVNPAKDFSDELYFDLLGSRKPVLFIEGDETHSIDSRLYQLVFKDYTVKPMGSCNRVIEATRTFNDLSSFHHLDSYGIVDRDRRDAKEVQYLRDKRILVPEVAEVENILMLEDVIRTVAAYYKKDPNKVFESVRKSVITMFRQRLKAQALQHVRHRVKHEVELRIDKRFSDINALEEHMVDLVNEINPRGSYVELCNKFHEFANANNYAAVLRVFNEKSILGESNVAGLCGLSNKISYINAVLNILKRNGEPAEALRRAVKKCFGLKGDEPMLTLAQKQ